MPTPDIKLQKHQTFKTRDGVRCNICLHSWSRQPQSLCPGLPRYEYGQWPEHLLTEAQCQAARLKPGPAAAVCQRAKSPQGWMRLYDKNAATAKPALSDAQQAALAKAQAAQVAKRTCTRCEREMSSKRELRGGLCQGCREMLRWQEDKRQAIAWAREILAGEFVVLDCETTGLDDDAEIIQISVIDQAGALLLSTYVRPLFAIDEQSGAFTINGISQAMVQNATQWPQACAQLCPLLAGKHVVAYNADFDLRMISNACREHQVEEPEARHWHCAMTAYAAFYGEIGRDYGEYRWQSLGHACQQMGVRLPAHEAASDCLATLALIRAMADTGQKEPDKDGQNCLSAQTD